MYETPRQDKNQFALSISGMSDGEQSIGSRRASKIPIATPKLFPMNSARFKKAPDKVLTKSMASPQPKKVTENSITEGIPLISTLTVSNTTLKEKKQQMTASSPQFEKSVRELEVKLKSTKKKFAALLEDISQKQSSAIRMRQDILNSINKLKGLTGIEQPFDVDVADGYSKATSSIADLVSNLPEGWLSVALKIANCRKNMIQKERNRKPTKEEMNDLEADIFVIEQEKITTNDKICLINMKVKEISLDATERIKAFEGLLEEKREEIVCLKNRLAKLESGKREEFPWSPRLITKYENLLKESHDERRKLEKEVSKKVEELSQLMKVLKEVQQRSPSEVLIKQKQTLDNELRDKNNLMKIVTEENKKLKETIEKMCASDQKVANCLQNDAANDQHMRHKRIQADLDPKHRSSRRQVQILKAGMRRLENTIKKLTRSEEPKFMTPVTNVIGQVKGAGGDRGNPLEQLNVKLKEEENSEIQRIECVLARMHEDKKNAFQQKISIINENEANFPKLLQVAMARTFEIIKYK